MRNRISTLIFLITCSIAFTSQAKILTVVISKSDTVVEYYKFRFNNKRFHKKVKSLDSADFVRIIYPDADRTLYTFKEYYKSGEKKFIGKIDGDTYERSHINLLTGYCVDYYANGKRRSVANYYKDYKVGLEYLYKPNGKLYAVIKWMKNGVSLVDPLLWSAYSDDGKLTCENGNGTGVIYNDDNDQLIYSGNVVNGYMEGPWKGALKLEDSINYICNFKKGRFLGGIGYDKNNQAYPFTNTVAPFEYNGGVHDGAAAVVDFVVQLNRHLTLPKDPKGNKMNIDTVHFTFVIEKDGSLSELTPLGSDLPLKDALNKAVTKCGTWMPSRLYGVPYRTQLTLSLKVKIDFLTRAISGNGKILFLPEVNMDTVPH